MTATAKFAQLYQAYTVQGQLTADLTQQIHDLLQQLQEQNRSLQVVGGPFEKLVSDFMTFSAAIAVDPIQKAKSFRAAFAHFFKLQDHIRALGCVAKAGTQFLELAEDISKQNNAAFEGQIVEQIKISQKFFAVACTLVDVIKQQERQDICGVFGFSAAGQLHSQLKNLERQLQQLQHRDCATQQEIDQNQYLVQQIIDRMNELQQKGVDSESDVHQQNERFSLDYCRRLFQKTTTILQLCSQPLGFCEQSGLSELQRDLLMQPSYALKLQPAELVNALAGRGDIDAALSLADAFQLSYHSVIQHLTKHLVVLSQKILFPQGNQFQAGYKIRLQHLLGNKFTAAFDYSVLDRFTETQPSVVAEIKLTAGLILDVVQISQERDIKGGASFGFSASLGEELVCCVVMWLGQVTEKQRRDLGQLLGQLFNGYLGLFIGPNLMPVFDQYGVERHVFSGNFEQLDRQLIQDRIQLETQRQPGMMFQQQQQQHMAPKYGIGAALQKQNQVQQAAKIQKQIPIGQRVVGVQQQASKELDINDLGGVRPAVNFAPTQAMSFAPNVGQGQVGGILKKGAGFK